jgi:hypothetical protein
MSVLFAIMRRTMARKDRPAFVRMSGSVLAEYVSENLATPGALGPLRSNGVESRLYCFLHLDSHHDPRATGCNPNWVQFLLQQAVCKGVILFKQCCARALTLAPASINCFARMH